jgi:hypothetical protein
MFVSNVKRYSRKAVGPTDVDLIATVKKPFEFLYEDKT